MPLLENGVRSGMRVANSLGCNVPWSGSVGAEEDANSAWVGGQGMSGGGGGPGKGGGGTGGVGVDGEVTKVGRGHAVTVGLLSVVGVGYYRQFHAISLVEPRTSAARCLIMQSFDVVNFESLFVQVCVI